MKYTTQEVAAKLQLNDCTIRKYARIYSLGKIRGKTRFFTELEVEFMNKLDKKPGPKKKSNKT